MSVFRALFALRPPEKRKAFVPFYVGGGDRPKSGINADDVYVYYLTFQNGFIVALLLTLLNIASWALGTTVDCYLFTIDLTGEHFTKTFLLTYPEYTSTILLGVSAYYLIVFRINIDPLTSNVSWRGPSALPIESVSKLHIWGRGLVCCLVVVIGMYGSYGLFALYMKAMHLENSVTYFLFCAIGIPFVIAAGNCLLLFFMTLLWRYGFRSSSRTKR
jgi:hypothetical protein